MGNSNQTQTRHDRLNHADNNRQLQHGDDEQGPVQCKVAARIRQRQMDKKSPQHEQLKCRGIMNDRQCRAAVVKHHYLMDHGQFQVGIRIVERDAAVFGQQHDEHPADEEQQRCAGVHPEPYVDVDQHPGEIVRAGETRQGNQGKKEGRFGKTGVGCLSGRTHSFKTRTGIKSGSHRKKTPQREQIGVQDHVAVKRDRRRVRAKRNQQRGYPGRCQRNNRSGTKHPGGGRTEHGPFLQQPDDIVIRLQERRTDTPGKRRFRFADHPEEQRRHDQCQNNMNGAVDDGAIHLVSSLTYQFAHSIRTKRVTKI